MAQQLRVVGLREYFYYLLRNITTAILSACVNIEIMIYNVEILSFRVSRWIFVRDEEFTAESLVSMETSFQNRIEMPLSLSLLPLPPPPGPSLLLALFGTQATLATRNTSELLRKEAIFHKTRFSHPAAFHAAYYSRLRLSSPSLSLSRLLQ